jgi:hypothetical protein
MPGAQNRGGAVAQEHHRGCSGEHERLPDQTCGG